MSESLTKGQQQFAGVFANETGLDPHVVGSWLKAEQSGEAAKGYENKGYYNWLNIARTDSGDASGAHSSVWGNPVSAAKATAEWIKGQGRIAKEYGTPAEGVRNILHSAGLGPEAEIHAIATSGWASSGYNGGNTLREIYHELSGQKIGVGTAMSRGLTHAIPGSAAPVIREEHKPVENPIDAIMAVHSLGTNPEAVRLQDNWNTLKSLFSEPEPNTGQAPDLRIAGENQGTEDRAVEWATKHLGKFSESEGNNLGPELDRLEKSFGMTGEPWCAIFATTVTSQGGASRAGRTASVADINQWATEGSHGYSKGLKPSSEARPGDLLTFGNAHVAVVKEVRDGTIVTIEGNANGSGGVVQLQHRVGEGQIARPIYGSH